jgi:hypothetical protein
VSPEEVVEQALDVLASELVVSEAYSHDSHIALTANGLDGPDVVAALGAYLVGLIAGVVRTSLELSAALLDQTLDGRAKLAAEIEALLSAPGGATQWTLDHFDANVRDPWIAEGIAHALLAVRNRADTLSLSGRVVAVTVPHVKPSQQGLDLVAIYEDDGLPALAIGEAKATLDNGSGRLTESIAFFRAVEAGDRDVDIRMQVVVLSEALDDSLRRALSAGFWHEKACYLPFIAHGDDVDMATPRPALRAIARPAPQKRVTFCRPGDYAHFFDGVADAMRRAVTTITA